MDSEENKQNYPTSQAEKAKLQLIELMKYQKMPRQAPKKLVEEIVSIIDPSYRTEGLFGCGMESFIIKVTTPMVDERCLKIVFPTEGIEGTRTVTIWNMLYNFGVGRPHFQVKNESISRTRFKDGAQIQYKLYKAIQEAHLTYFTVPEVYKVSESPLYIEMEWIPSVHVLSWLHEKHDLVKSLKCFCNLCKAVQFFHDRGIIHRDLKPDNIYIWHNDGVCILDWTIAKPIGDRNLTLSGMRLGTQPYISPMQFQQSKAATHLDDLHCLGYTFAAFVLDKELPTILETKQEYDVILAKLRKKLIEDMPEIMQPIFLKATEPDENNRYQNADDMRKDIEKIIEFLSPPQNVFKGDSVSVVAPLSTNPLDDKTTVFPVEAALPIQNIDPEISEFDMQTLARHLSDQMIKKCALDNLNLKGTCPNKDNCDNCQKFNESFIIMICKVVMALKQWRPL